MGRLCHGPDPGPARRSPTLSLSPQGLDWSLLRESTNFDEHLEKELPGVCVCGGGGRAQVPAGRCGARAWRVYLAPPTLHSRSCTQPQLYCTACVLQDGLLP